MKKFKSFILIFWVCMACEKTNTVETASFDLTQKLSKETNAFSLKFWSNFDAQEKTENYVVSPLSLNIALSMLLNGAQGDTQTEIQNALGLQNQSIETINKKMAELLRYLPLADSKTQVSIANAIFKDKNFNSFADFNQNLSTYFSAKLLSEDFKSAATVNKINQWASDNTQQKINKIIEKIEPDQVMFLMNALYFKGNWANAFKPSNTRKQVFKGIRKNQEVDMMNMADQELNFKETDQALIVELPYGANKYNFYVILPKNSIPKTLSELSQNTWENYSSGFRKTKIILALPKFTLEYKKQLKETLQSMGILKAFTQNANLSKISADKLIVNSVQQNAYIALDEKGTEAAAVTSVGIGVTSIPVLPEVICDKPFLFAIGEKETGSLFFAGKIVQL
jgi:serine protease inhibitor